MGLFGLHLPKKIDDAFGNIGQAVQGAERQINPFDNGATYSRPTAPAGQQAPPSIGTQVADIGGAIAGFGSKAGVAVNQQVAQPLFHTVEQAPADIYIPIANQIAKWAGQNPVTAASIANNPNSPDVLRNSIKAGATGNINQLTDTGKQMLQFIPRSVIQLRNSAAEGLGGNGGGQELSNFKPQPGASQTILGKEPIPSLQKVFKDTKKQTGTQQAAINTAITGGLDLLALKGTVDSGIKLTGKGASTVKVVGGNDAAVNKLIADAKTQSLLKPTETVKPETPSVPTVVPADVKVTAPKVTVSNTGKVPPLYTKEALNNPTVDELSMGEALGMSPADVRRAKMESNKPDVQLRSAEAEQAALEHLKNGGLRPEAVKIYQDATGASEKTAKFNVQRAAREAKVPLNVSAETHNPYINDFNGLYKNVNGAEDIARSRMAIKNTIDRVSKDALSYENKLSEADRADLPHYIQGEKIISAAEDPALVQEAVNAWTRAADVVHAIGQNFGNTKHIEKFYPGYWDRADPNVLKMDTLKAEQMLEEQLGPDAWRNLSQSQKDELLSKEIQNTTINTEANYSGFHNKSKIFQSQAEGVTAGQKPMFDNPYDAMRRYFTGAKMQLGDQAVIQGVRTAEPTYGGPTRTIDLATGKASASPKLAKELKKWGVTTPRDGVATYSEIGTKISDADVSVVGDLAKKGWRGLNTSIIKTIVANPIFHGGNQEFNGLFRVAWDMPGNKVANMVNTITNQIATPKAVRSAVADEYFAHGGVSPTYGKGNYGFIANSMKAVFGENGAKVAEVSPTAMAGIEQNIRLSLYKMGRDQGMTPTEAIRAVDRSLGSPKVLGDMSDSIGLFWHYFTTNLKSLGYTGTELTHGNVAPILGLAIGYGSYVAANKAWQAATGNPNATVRAPGVIGTATQLAKAPGQLERKQFPTVLTNHINPAINTGLGLIANRDLRKPVFGHSSSTNKIVGPGGEGLSSYLRNNLFGPGQTVGNVASDKTSLGEAGLNAGLGMYIPHAKGNPGAPNIPALNDKTVTINGQSVKVKSAKGNDPTGYQQQQAYYKTQTPMYKGLSNDDTKRLDGILASETDPNGAKIGGNDKEAMAKSAEVYAHPDLLNRITKQKQDYAKATGQPLDPLYDNKQLTSDQRLTYMKLQSLPYKSDEYVHLLNANKDWMRSLEDARSTYFNGLDQSTLPKSERVQPPQFPESTNSLLDQADKLTGSEKGTFISDHPELQDAYKQLAEYTAKRIDAQGGAPRDVFPVASPEVEAIIKQYNAVPLGGGSKGGNKFRGQWISAHPQEYSQMTNFFTRAALYGLEKSASQAQFKDTGFDSKGLGDIYNIGNYDIVKGKDANGKATYNLTTGASGGATTTDENGNTFSDLGMGSGNPMSGSGSSSRKSYSKKAPYMKGGGRVFVKRPYLNKNYTKTSKVKVSKSSKLGSNGGNIKVSTTKLRIA